MAGVGETGVWRTGVWVEPLDAEGDFALSAAAVTEFTGRFAFGGQFDLEGTALLTFDGDLLFRGDFDLEGNADLGFDGDFVPNPGQGAFQMDASAELNFDWVPDVSGPGDAIPDTPAADAVPKLRPGDAFTFNGIAGICHLDEQGRLVVIDDSGEVMCIIGPSGAEPA